MSKKVFCLFALAACGLTLAACTAVQAPATNTNEPAVININEPAAVNTNAADVNANAAPADNSAAIANPASANCVKVGGKLVLESRTYQGQDIGQIGVCYFEDNRQCEEWALMRGTCPVGGVKVTGYASDAARFCAITGGVYAISSPNQDPKNEQGTCARAGKTCDVWKYYTGECQPAN